MTSDRSKTIAEGRIAVTPPMDIIRQEKPRARIPLRLAPAIDYPETIDVELPDSFINDHGNQERKCNEQKGRRLWRMELIAPLPAGWNPSLLVLRERAPSPSHEISITFRKTPRSLLQLPTELRLHILKYLLRSITPITNPRVGGYGASKKKSTPTVHVQILRSCRQLYYEGTPILYQENTFRFTESAPWLAFCRSRLSSKYDGVRHLELQTTVAERYCHRVFRVQGQQAVVQEIRTRGPAGWDWPFLSPWRFSELHTLKLDLKDFHLLPTSHPPTTAHFNPDPTTKEGRDARLSQWDVGVVIYQSCMKLELKDLTLLGIPNIRHRLLLELAILHPIYTDFVKYIQRHEEVVRYLASRTGGWWESQTVRSKVYWGLADRRFVEEYFRLRVGPASDGASAELGTRKLALLWFMRTRAAKHGPNDPPTRKPPSILWTW